MTFKEFSTDYIKAFKAVHGDRKWNHADVAAFAYSAYLAGSLAAAKEVMPIADSFPPNAPAVGLAEKIYHWICTLCDRVDAMTTDVPAKSEMN